MEISLSMFIKGVHKNAQERNIERKINIFMFLKHKIYSSAIVGGVLPISLGMALSLKRKNQIVKFCLSVI